MRTDPPKIAKLIAPAADLDFLNCHVGICRPDLTALDAYHSMTEQTSSLLGSAFWLRDAVSSLFGVEKIRGFTAPEDKREPTVGDKLDFFEIESIAPQQLVLSSRDTHLETLLCLDIIQTKVKPSQLFVTSSVVTKNTFGKVYMAPVSMAHGVIVERMLKRIVPSSTSTD